MSEQLEQRKALNELDEFIRGLLPEYAKNVRLGEPDAPFQAGDVLVHRAVVVDCFLKANKEYERFRDACHEGDKKRPNLIVLSDQWDAARDM